MVLFWNILVHSGVFNRGKRIYHLNKMHSFYVIPSSKHKVVQYLVRKCDTLFSDYCGAMPLSRKRCGKTREMPGFSVNPGIFIKLLYEPQIIMM